MRRMWFFLAAGLIAGCGSNVGSKGGGRADLSVGRPVSTNIPEGIYFGESTTHAVWSVNGIVVEDVTETSQDSEVVDANGLPLMQPEGVAPVEGVVLTQEIAGFVTRIEVLSVFASGNRLIINYQFTIEFEQLVIEGTGKSTYEYIPPDTLRFQDEFSGFSNVSPSGDRASISYTTSGTLTRGESASPAPPSPPIDPDEPLPPQELPPIPPREPDDPPIVDAVLEATWLVLFGNDSSLGTATAFGVDGRTLATNAHVVDGIADAFCGVNPFAGVVQHETGAIRTITRVWVHPDYLSGSPVPTADVGILEVDEPIPASLELADDRSLQELAVFDEVSLCGFPGDVTFGIDIGGLFTGEFRPRATCLTGTISALRPFDAGEASTPANTQLIQYDLPVAPGTSGSAAFDSLGRVVGVNSFGFSNTGGDFNFAIRGDVLLDLIQKVDDGSLDPVDLSPCVSPIASDGLRPGQWEGRTAQDKTITFRVLGNNLTDIAFGYVVDSPFCFRDVVVERCFDCSAITLRCSFAASWTTEQMDPGQFFVFADGCSDANNTTAFGRVAAFLSDCLGFVSDVQWTASWIGP